MRSTSLLLASVLFLSSRAFAEIPSRVFVVTDKAQTAFTHVTGEGEPLADGVKPALEVEAYVFDALTRLASGANPLLFNWFDQIAKTEDEARYRLTLESAEARYSADKRPIGLTLRLRRHIMLDVRDGWSDGGLYTANSEPPGGRIDGKEAAAAFRRVLFLVPLSRGGAPCPWLLTEMFKLGTETDGVWR